MARLFAAIVPPPDAVEHLDEFLEPRRESGSQKLDMRWTSAEQFHITLAFMASVPDHLNFIEGLMLPLTVPFLGRG